VDPVIDYIAVYRSSYTLALYFIVTDVSLIDSACCGVSLAVL
jgi:hypothetical protein